VIASLRYESGFQDPLLAEIAYVVDAAKAKAAPASIAAEASRRLIR
jgi:hypothetical protein